MTNPTQRSARLVRGKRYVLSGKVFEAQKWVDITEAEYEHLRVNAVDLVTISGGGQEVPESEQKQKFQFRTADQHDGGQEEVAPKPVAANARRRSR